MLHFSNPKVYEMDNYIPDVPEQTTGSIAKKPRATRQ